MRAIELGKCSCDGNNGFQRMAAKDNTRIREIYFTVKKFNQSIYAYNITSNINNS